MVQGLAGMRRLVQTLQDQLDSSSSSSAPSQTEGTPSDDTARKPSSHAQAFALDTVRRFSRERVAAKAAWALANIAANNKEGQDTVRYELLHCGLPCGKMPAVTVCAACCPVLLPPPGTGAPHGCSSRALLPGVPPSAPQVLG